MSDNHGAVWWSELMTRDVAAAKAYYEQVCGWSFSSVPMSEGEYNLGMHGGKPVIGIMDISSFEHLNGVPAHWFTYLAVDDLDVALEQTKVAGGSVMREPFEVPNTGWIAIVKDPSGAAVGLIKPEAMG